jgi:hypothetical protein
VNRLADGLADLPLAGLSPSDYVIEIRAKSATNETTELIAIKIGS